MRYFFRDSTLFLRGDFSAASTGIQGGIQKITTLLNHTVHKDFHQDPVRFLKRIVTSEGYSEAYFGLLTAVEMRNLCILQYDFITVFVTAGVADSSNEKSQTINIIVYSSEGLSHAALLESIIIVTEAKVKALHTMGYTCTGTSTDAVITACEGEVRHMYAGILTGPGRRIYSAVAFGVQEALKRGKGEIERSSPSFFIYSRYGGDHWVEWRREECPYYPCHFEGQRCDFCYCPFYPCLELDLGQWVESSSGGKVWSCSTCTLLHEPEITEYLKNYPEAPLTELKALRKRLKNKKGYPGIVSTKISDSSDCNLNDLLYQN
jgi:adenosylcobinamide hydrolase